MNPLTFIPCRTQGNSNPSSFIPVLCSIFCFKRVLAHSFADQVSFCQGLSQGNRKNTSLNHSKLIRGPEIRSATVLMLLFADQTIELSQIERRSRFAWFYIAWVYISRENERVNRAAVHRLHFIGWNDKMFYDWLSVMKHLTLSWRRCHLDFVIFIREILWALTLGIVKWKILTVIFEKFSIINMRDDFFVSLIAI